MMAVHPNGKLILGENNIAFQHGPQHKELRASFLPLFTPKALAEYVTQQYSVVQRHVDAWLAHAHAGKGSTEFRLLARDLNQETSQQVFVGTL
jgi:cytochrome P450 family 710 subfamily A protein